MRFSHQVSPDCNGGFHDGGDDRASAGALRGGPQVLLRTAGPGSGGNGSGRTRTLVGTSAAGMRVATVGGRRGGDAGECGAQTEHRRARCAPHPGFAGQRPVSADLDSLVGGAGRAVVKIAIARKLAVRLYWRLREAAPRLACRVARLAVRGESVPRSVGVEE